MFLSDVGASKHKCEYDQNIDIINGRMSVTIFAVPGLVNVMMDSSIAIIHVMQQLKHSKWYWKTLRIPAGEGMEKLFVTMLANIDTWHGEKILNNSKNVIWKAQCSTCLIA